MHEFGSVMYWFLRSSPQAHIQSSMLNSNDNNENKGNESNENNLKTEITTSQLPPKIRQNGRSSTEKAGKTKEIVEDGLY